MKNFALTLRQRKFCSIYAVVSANEHFSRRNEGRELKNKLIQKLRAQVECVKTVLTNSEQKGYALDNLIPLVETSNRQKLVARIVERGVTRVSEPNVSSAKHFDQTFLKFVLKSAELILLIVYIIAGKELSKRKGLCPVSMENIAFFVPA